MSVKACIGSMMVGMAVGVAAIAVIPMPSTTRCIRRVRRYIKNML